MATSNLVPSLNAEPIAHTLICERVALAAVKDILPPKYYESLEQNQQIETCCRNPTENADISAWATNDEDAGKGMPDLYKVHCNVCGRAHARFCVGSGVRPAWEVK